MVRGISEENSVILILSKDRLKYLAYTWQSLSKTSSLPVYLYDDGSSDQDLIRFLTSDGNFLLSNNIDINCETLSRYVGWFPPITNLDGISSKINLQRRNLGHTQILFSAIREIFEQTNFEYIIQLEDDVVFKRGWLQTLMRVWNDWSAVNKGILCSCSVQNELRHPKSGILTGINPTFQCVVIPRYIYEIDREWFNGPWKFRTKCDLYTVKYCQERDFLVGVLGESVCQHIGVDSLDLKTYEVFSSNYKFDRRVDLSVDPPFVL